MMELNDFVTGVTVCWNTKDLIERSVGSIHKFHPEIKIIIIDGSPEGSECYQYLHYLKQDNIEVYQVKRNIGHGKGMAYGMERVQTPYALVFDSDIEMVKSPLLGMLEMMEEDIWGVGYCERVGYDGFDYGTWAKHKTQEPVKYMHPYFHLVQKSVYVKFPPYIHHGAPSVRTMVAIHRAGLSDRILKEFPGLGHTSGKGFSWEPCAGEYVLHDVVGFGGTGRMRVAQGLPHIEGTWERV